MNRYIIVTGFPRTGTSAMMGALEAGGLLCAYAKERPADHNNAKGYYELTKQALRNEALLRTYLENAIKIHLPDLLTKLHSADDEGFYFIIYMHRNFEAMKQSAEHALGDCRFNSEEAFRKMANAGLKEVKAQLNTRLVEVDYDFLIDSPELVFDNLLEAGLGLDAEAACKFLSPELRHF